MQTVLTKIKVMIGGVSGMVGGVKQFLFNQLNQAALTLQILKSYLAPNTSVEQSPKQEPISAKPEPTLNGQQPAQTAHKTRRRAKPASKKGK